MRKQTDELLEEVCSDLMGMCQSLEDVLENNGTDFDQLAIEDFHFIDERVWCCSVCGWWTEPSDVNDDDVCTDCQENDE